MHMMFFRAKKPTNILFKLCYEFASITKCRINSAPKPRTNPSKSLDTNPKVLEFLGMVYNPWSQNVGCSPLLFKRVYSLSAGGVKHKKGVEGLQEMPDFDGFEEPEIRPGNSMDKSFIRNVESIMSILKQFESLSPEARAALENSRVVPTTDLVQEVLYQLRNDWKSAFTCFLWAGSEPGYKHTFQTYNLMIFILGKLRRFNIAWGLIKEMQESGGNGRSMVTYQTFLIMIRSYSAVHDVGRAIKTFYALEEYKLKANVRAFQGLLDALCRHKNVGCAEQLLYDKKDVFGNQRRTFNIVLNGWCNMIVNVDEAKRFWKVMADHGIRPDADSYNSMICCFSKTGSLHDVINLFDEMKRRNCAPDRKVYNSMVYSLAKGNYVKEACNLLNAMAEKGFTPDAESYNSLIIPLCKGQRLEDAYMIFDEMIEKGHAPSIRTFHALFIALKDPKETMKLFEKMREGNCTPTVETFVILIRKFCRWHEFENVFKLWNNMMECGLGPDCSSYIVLIHGLFLNGKPEEARKYYEEMKAEEMKAKCFSHQTKIDKMINTWITARESAAVQLLKLKEKRVHKSLEEEMIENTRDNSIPWWKKDRKANWR